MKTSVWADEAERQRAALELEKELVLDLLGELVVAEPTEQNRRTSAEQRILEEHFSLLGSEQARLDRELRALAFGPELVGATVRERAREVHAQHSRLRSMLELCRQESAAGRARRMRDRFWVDALSLEFSRLDSEAGRIREQAERLTGRPALRLSHAHLQSVSGATSRSVSGQSRKFRS
ncbi:MAG: hypothetical protein QOD06_1478 [Candidatus Binatota bacterium]|jgi:hypothetical protein|nr:hypothetical protein [Candidatus Binatota bacterium]